MQSIILPNFPRLKGEEAIAALDNFIEKLETREKKLTKKQVKTLKKLAKGIISSIEADQNKTVPRKMGFTSKLSASILGRS